jgi:hypothetical protein
VQSSCDGNQSTNDCDQCGVERDLLVHLSASIP